MKLYSVVLALLVGTLFYIIAGSAQNGSANDAWRWIHYGPETGLPSIPVYRIIEAEDSTIWATTGNGLMWFDGYQWNMIDASNKLLAEYSKILPPVEGTSNLYVVNAHALFIGNKSGFRKVVDHVNDAIPFGRNQVLVRYLDKLFLYENGEVKSLPDYPAIDSVGNEDLLWYSNVGHKWLTAKDGLYIWQDGKWKRRIMTSPRHLSVTDLIEQPDGKTLLSLIGPGSELGIWELTLSNRFLYKYPRDFYTKMAFEPSSAGSVIAISNFSEITLYSGNQFSAKIELPVKGLRILGLYFSRDGNLWIGTTDGLYCYRLCSSRWTLFDTPSKKNENILELMKTRDGKIWAGTQHGVNIYSNNKLVQSITKINGILLTAVTGLNEDNDGNIWISSGSGFRGAFRWDGSEWKHVSIGDTIGSVFIHKIRKDRQGKLWFLGVGTYYAIGKQPGAFLLADGKFLRYRGEEGLHDGRVYSFGQTSDSTLWFGTAGGLSSQKGGKWTHWDNLVGFNLARVFALAIDREDNVWLSDRWTKVACLHPDGKITYFTTSSVLPDSNIWDIRVDSSGIVWFTSERGLAAYNHGVWTTYDSRSGLVKFPLWPVLPLGKEVFLGTLGNGVICLHPDECEQPPPKIIVENPIVEGDGVLLRWSPIAFQGEPSQANIPTRYRINREQWSAWGTTHEVMLHRLSPGSYFYQIQAKNLIGRVDSAGQLGVFTISPPLFYRPAFLLPVGLLSLGLFLFGFSYVLSIKKRDTALRISEAKFRKLTESTFDGVLIHDEGKILDANDRLALMFGYAPSDFLRKDLSELIAEDFRSFTGKGNIQKPVETWGLRKDGSKVWIEYVEQEIPYGKIKARIAAIRNITERKQSEERLGRYREGLKALALQLSSTEERERREVATYLHDYISQALGFCKMKLGTMKGEVSEKDILEVRGYIEDMFEKTQSLTFELSPPILYELGLEAAIGSLADRMQAQYDLRINYDSSDQPIALNEKISLFLFYSIRELLINVVKHADASEANIRILREDNTLRISVMDNGKGFSASKGKIRQKEEGGFGLFNIQERLTHFGGRMDIVPHPDRGTIVTLMVPLERRRAEQEGKSN
jgi:PAS domain S-box-containing protein